MKLARLSYFFSIIFLISSLAPVSYSATLVQRYEGGALYERDGLAILSLQGSWSQIGRQYGALYSAQIDEMYESAVQELILDQDLYLERTLVDISQALYQHYPKHIRDSFEAMSFASGIELSRLIILNELFSIELLASEDQTSIDDWQEMCSTLVVWGDASENSQSMMGRNFDGSREQRAFSSLLTLVILNPGDGGEPSAFFAYPGQLSTFGGLNRAGIALSENVAKYSGDDRRYTDRLSKGVANLQALTGHKRIEALLSSLRVEPVPYPTVVNLAGFGRGVSLEANTSAIKTAVHDTRSFIASTNHFVDPFWQAPLPGPSESDTVLRRQNLIQQTATASPLSVEDMQALLEADLAAGGSASERTLYRWIALPEEQRMLVQAPGALGWIDIDLNKFFPSVQAREELEPIRFELIEDPEITPLTDGDGNAPPVRLLTHPESFRGFNGALIELPQGGRLETVNGVERIAIKEASFEFAPTSPIQLPQPLSATHENEVYLPIGDIDFSEIADLFGVNAESGLETLLFNKIPFEWTGGTITEQGIKNLSGRILIDSFPLPEIQIPFFDHLAAFDLAEGIELPISGEFSLPDGSPFRAEIRADENDPLILRISPSGEISMSGSVECSFGAAMQLPVELTYADDEYTLTLRSERLINESRNALFTLIDAIDPEPVEELAAEDLTAYGERLKRIARGLTASNGDSQWFDLDAALLADAWSQTAGLIDSDALPDEFSAIFALCREGALSAESLNEALQLFAVSVEGLASLDDLASNQNLDSIRASLLEVVADLDRTAQRLIPDEELPSSIGHLAELADKIAQLANAADAAGIDELRFVEQKAPQWLEISLTNALSELNIEANRFSSDGNEAVTELSEHAALDLMNELSALSDDISLIDPATLQAAPLDEAISQISQHASKLWFERLDAALNSGRYSDYAYAANELAKIYAARALGRLPETTALDDLPSGADIQGMLDQLVEFGDEAPLTRDASNLLDEAMKLGGILESIQSTPVLQSLQGELIHFRLGELLQELIDREGEITGIEDGIRLIESAVCWSSIAEEFGVKNNALDPAAWLGEFIASFDGEENGSDSDRFELLDSLIDAGLEQAQGIEERREFLGAAAGLMDELRSSARSLVDALPEDKALPLPGGARLYEGVGSISYHRLDQTLTGRLQGEIELPPLNDRLHIETATISSGGALQLTAYGELGFGAGRAIVSPHAPITLSIQAGAAPEFSGQVDVALENGMRFQAGLKFEEPDYAIALRAEDIALDSLSGLAEVLPSVGSLHGRSIEELRAINEHYRDLNLAFASINNQGEARFGEVSRAPLFTESADDPLLPLMSAFASGLSAAERESVNAQAVDSIPSRPQQLSAGIEQAILELLMPLVDQSNRYLQSQDELDRSIESLLNLKQIFASVQRSFSELLERNGQIAALINDDSEFQSMMNSLVVRLRTILENDGAVMNPRQGEVVIEIVDEYEGLNLILSNNNEPLYPSLFELVIPFIRDLLNAQVERWGIDYQSGEIVDGERFADFSREELESFIREIDDLQASFSVLGDIPDANEFSSINTIRARIRELIIREYATIEKVDTLYAYDLIDWIESYAQGVKTAPLMVSYPSRGIDLNLNEVPLDADIDLHGLIYPEKLRIIQSFKTKQENENDPNDVFQPHENFFFSSVQLFRVVLKGYPAEVMVFLDRQAQRRLTRMAEYLDQLFTVDQLPEMLDQTRLLSDVVYWLKYRRVVDNLEVSSMLNQIVEGLEPYADRFKKAAETPELQKMAYQFNDQLLRIAYYMSEESNKEFGIPTSGNQTLRTFSSPLVTIISMPAQAESDIEERVKALAANMLADQQLLASRSVNDLRAGFIQPDIIELPAGWVIRSVYGRAEYNRETALFAAQFGGRLEFGDAQGFLEINEASIDSSGAAAFRASSEFPLGFSGIQAFVDELSVLYDGELAANGSGRLSLPNGSVIEAAIGFDSGSESFFFESGSSSLSIAPGLVLTESSPGRPIIRVLKNGSRYSGEFAANFLLPDGQGVTIEGGMDHNSFQLKLPEPLAIDGFEFLGETGRFTLERLRLEYGDHDPNDDIASSGLAVSGRGTLEIDAGGETQFITLSLSYEDGSLQWSARAENLRIELPGGVIIELDEGSVALGDSFEGEFSGGRVVYLPGLPGDDNGDNASLEIAYLSFISGAETLHLDCAGPSAGEPSGMLTLPGGHEARLNRLTINYGGIVPDGAPTPTLGFQANAAGQLALFGDGGFILPESSFLETEAQLNCQIAYSTGESFLAAVNFAGQTMSLDEIDASLNDGFLAFFFSQTSEEFDLTVSGGVSFEDIELSIIDEDPFRIAARGASIEEISGSAELALPNESKIAFQASYTPEEGFMLAAGGEVHFGDGVRLHEINGVPVLALAVDSESAYFEANGGVEIPIADGELVAIEASGRLRIDTSGSSPIIGEFFVASVVDQLDWTLPGDIRIANAFASLDYDQQRFAARFGGRIESGLDTSLELDAELQLNAEDPEDIRIAATLQASRVNLFDQAVLFASQAELNITTKPLAGELGLSGDAGLFPKANVPAPLEPGALSADDFLVNVESFESRFDFSPDGFLLTLASGQLRLPGEFSAGLCDGAGGGPSVSLSPQNPVVFGYERNANQFSLTGDIQFFNLGVNAPGNETLAIELCQATLRLQAGQLPVLDNIEGQLRVPLPQDELQIALRDIRWDLSGYPTGIIALENNVTLIDDGGFILELLGEGEDGCPASGLTIEEGAEGPVVTIAGGAAVTVPPEMLSADDGTALNLSSCGSLTLLPNQPPILALDEIAGAGSFRLGGSGGLQIQNAAIEARGVQFILNPTVENPFALAVSGDVAIPNGPEFGLERAQFLFEGQPLPRFTIEALRLDEGESFELVEGLPARISEGQIRFRNPELPLPDLLRPDNIELGLSGVVSIPPGPEPIISGRVDDLIATINEQGNLELSVSGIGLGISGLELGPLVVAGEAYIGGLDNLPEGLFFAGRMGGKMNGAGVVALVAFNMNGPIGACLDVGAGPAGIPIAYGFVINGVAGGVSFANTNASPCDFTTYIELGADNRPLTFASAKTLGDQASPLHSTIPLVEAMSWDEVRDYNQRYEIYRDLEEFYSTEQTLNQSRNYAFASPVQAAQAEFEVPCPSGECPPAAVNILCQPHPDAERYPDRVIVKFTSIPESLLNEIGITESFIAGTGWNTAEEIGTNAAQILRDAVDAAWPSPDPALLGDELAVELEQLIATQLDQMQAGLANQISNGVSGVLGDSASVYEAIVEAAYAGAQCPDITVELSGTFSHLAVSTFLTLTGGYSVSTAGSVGLMGSVNLLGVPVGTMNGFYMNTDSRGDPNPSVCGTMNMALGPLELGSMQFVYQCEGCVTAMLGSLVEFGTCLSEPAIREIVNLVAPRLATASVEEALQQMTPQEGSAFFAQLFSLPPERLSPDLAQCLFNLIEANWELIQPEIMLCGEANPKIFGIPMGAEVFSIESFANKHELAGNFGFSPSYIFNNTIGCVLTAGLGCTSIFPTVDTATFGYNLAVPDPVPVLLGGLSGELSSPAAFAQAGEDSFADALERTTFTIGYEFKPFGLRMANAEARVVMPNLTDHPSHPQSDWVRPETRGLPSRLDLTLAALERDLLATPLWRGNENDLANVFEGQPDLQEQIAGLSFQTDYFPHGGMIGAARLEFPSLVIDGPPDYLPQILTDDGDPLQRLSLAATFIEESLLTTKEAGSMAFYIPAPNPPSFTDASGDPLTPQQIMRAIQTFDPASLSSGTELYPLEEAFMQGYINGRLLGVPVAESEIDFEPPNRFRVYAETPSDSWLHEFVGDSSFEFVMGMEQTPQELFDERIAILLEDIRVAIQQQDADQAQTGMSDFVSGIQQGLPKTALEAQIDNLRVPGQLEALIAPAAASASLFAYSPLYDPDAEGEGPVATARREGGIVMQGAFRFGGFIDVENAELGVFPKPDGPPRLAGRFDIPTAALPNGIGFHNILAQFDSEPAPGQPFLLSSGELDEFAFDLPSALSFEIEALDQTQSRISAFLDLRRPSSGSQSVNVNLAISPARVQYDLFGSEADISIHGQTEADPFTFSTDGPWNASLRLQGRTGLFDPAVGTIVSFGNLNNPLIAMIDGRGFGFDEIGFDIPQSVAIQTFPDLSASNQLSGLLKHEITLGSAGAPISLRVQNTGAFELSGCIQGELNLDDLPVDSIETGACVIVTNSFITFSGEFSGGVASDTGGFIEGQLTVFYNGDVEFQAETFIDPIQIGIFRVASVDGGPLRAVIDGDGLRVEGGARLSVGELSAEALTLEAFTINADGSFDATIRSGGLASPDFALSGGVIEFSRDSDGEAMLIANAPTLLLFPGEEIQQRIPLGRVAIDSTPRFQYSTGDDPIDIQLFNQIAATGRLEFGYEPDPAQPQLIVEPRSLDFGDVEVGSYVERSFEVANAGGSPLVILMALDEPAPFAVSNAGLSLQPGQSATITVRFNPNETGSHASTLRLLNNSPAGERSLPLRGESVALPRFDASFDAIDFGEQPVGDGDIRRLVITNLGTADLTASNVEISGPFQTNTSDFVIEPKESRTLLITFMPETRGAAQGELVFQTNDGRRSIDLAGEGVEQRWYVQRQSSGIVRSIEAIDDQTAWAVGDSGLILSTDNAGRAWRRLSFAGSLSLTDIEFSDSDPFKGWVVGQSGAAYYTLDGGLNWTPSSDIDTLGSWNDAYINNDGLAIFVGERGGIVQETALDQFIEPEDDVTFADLNAIDGSGLILIAVGDNSTLLRSVDGGSSWSQIFVPTSILPAGAELYDVSMSDDGAAIIVGQFGIIIRSDDFGAAWSQSESVSSQQFLYDVEMSGDSAWVVGNQGVVFVSGDRGETWTAEGAGQFVDQYAMALSGSDVWSGGRLGTILHRPSTPPAGPVLTISDGFIDFGSVAVGDSSRRLLTLFNRGAAPLRLGGMSVVGGGFSFSAQSGSVIEPGHSLQVPVLYSPVQAVEPSPNVPNGELTIESDDPVGPIDVALRGASLTSTWQETAGGVTRRQLHTVQFVSDQTGFALSRAGSFDHLYKTLDGGDTWERLDFPYSGQLNALQFLDSNTGWIVGGDGGLVNDSIIYRTLDGGESWTRQTTGLRNAMADIHMLNFNIGYICTERVTSGQFPPPGDVLKTTNGGDTWTAVNRPSTSFSGGRIFALSESTLYTSSGGELYYSTNSGSSWTQIANFGGARPIEDLFFADESNGWLSGVNGLMRRTSNGSASSPVWTAPSSFTNATIQSVFFIDSQTGWCVSRGANSGGVSRLFRSSDGGETWSLELEIDNDPLWAVTARSSERVWAVGAEHRVWRLEPVEVISVARLAMAEAVDFGSISVEESSIQTVTLENIGSEPLEIFQARIEDASNESAFRLINSIANPILPGESAALQIEFSPGSSGEFDATLIVTGDFEGGIAEAGLGGQASQQPVTVIVTSAPEGALIEVDGQQHVTPVAFDDWLPGETRLISAPRDVTVDGTALRFQSWTASLENEFVFTVGSDNQTIEALYAPAALAASEPKAASVRMISLARPQQIETPLGFYLRLSDASLSIPALGDFKAQGEILLSRDLISASISSKGINIPQDRSKPRLLDVSSGSWSFEYRRKQYMRLSTASPQVDAFGLPVSAAGSMEIEIGANGHYSAALQTDSSLKLLPEVFELGPGMIQAEYDGFHSLQVQGSINALKDLDGDWVYQRPLDWDIAEGPFELALTGLPDPLLDTGEFQLRPGSLSFERSAQGVISLKAVDWRAEALGRNLLSLNGRIGSDGLLAFEAQPPLEPFEIGVFQFESQGANRLEWDIPDNRFEFEIAASALKAPLITGWPSDGFSFPGFTIDSEGRFDVSIPLPQINFNGIALGEENDPDERYIRLKRTDGMLEASIKDRQEYFLSTMDVDLLFNSDGEATGSMAGVLQADLSDLGLPTLVLGSFSMAYDSLQPIHPFKGRTRAFGLDLGVYFGPGGGQICHLACDDPEDEPLSIENCGIGALGCAFE